MEDTSLALMACGGFMASAGSGEASLASKLSAIEAITSQRFSKRAYAAEALRPGNSDAPSAANSSDNHLANSSEGTTSWFGMRPYGGRSTSNYSCNGSWSSPSSSSYNSRSSSNYSCDESFASGEDRSLTTSSSGSEFLSASDDGVSHPSASPPG